MARTETPICDFGLKAVDFDLPGTDGASYTLDRVAGPNGLLVMFICNHCPYVKAIVDRIVRDAKILQNEGIGVIAVMPNDTERYPEDSFSNMKRFAADNGFTFPYVIDETQEVARAYGAVCTPDFFGYNANLELQYRGRLDSSGKQPTAADTRSELVDAMRQVAKTKKGPEVQISSMGCSIKWRPEGEDAA